MKSFLVRKLARCLPAILAAAALGSALACEKVLGPGSPGIAVSPDTLTLPIAGRKRFTVTVTRVAPPLVAYASSDTGVVVVDSTGLMRAVGFGTAYVRAWAVVEPTLTDSARVIVPQSPGVWVVLRPDSVQLATLASTRLAWKVGGTTDSTVLFRSSDSTTASVDGKGIVCGLKVGSVVIRARAAADTTARDSSHVYVVKPPTTPGAVSSVTVAADSTSPTVSILSITDTAGNNVDRQNVKGTVKVSVIADLPACGPAVTAALLVDGQPWQTSPDAISGSGQTTRVFTLDTRATDTTGQPRVPNGSHTLLVTLTKAGGTVIASASLVIVVAN